MLVGVNVVFSWFVKVVSILNCKTRHISFLHPRLPISGDSCNMNLWQPPLDNIISRLLSWKSRNISYLSGRLVFLKFIYCPLFRFALFPSSKLPHV